MNEGNNNDKQDIYQYQVIVNDLESRVSSIQTNLNTFRASAEDYICDKVKEK